MSSKRPGENPANNGIKRKKDEEEQLKQEKSSTPHINRSCRICLTDVPRFIDVFVPCGHPICRACSLKLRWDASKEDSAVICSTCRGEGKFLVMKEILNEGREGTEDKMKEEGDSSVDQLVLLDIQDEDRMIEEVSEALTAELSAGHVSIHANSAATAANNAVIDNLTTGKLALTVLTAHLMKKYAIDRYRIADCSQLRDEAYAEAARFTAAAAVMSEEEATVLADESESREEILQEAAAKAKEIANAARDRYEIAAKMSQERRGRVKRMIEFYKEKNGESADLGYHFSCGSCKRESPSLRSFFPACGHPVCRGCADLAHASNADGTKCPICKTKGDSIALFEGNA